MSQEVQRLLQAVEHFKARSKGAELPKGAMEAVDGLAKALGEPMPARDTPGAREALKASQGTGTGTALRHAATGTDGPSPGQREVQGIQEQIQQAVASIAGSPSKA